eukprot:17373-Heterococcus_DN1.PRE.1
MCETVAEEQTCASPILAIRDSLMCACEQAHHSIAQINMSHRSAPKYPHPIHARRYERAANVDFSAVRYTATALHRRASRSLLTLMLSVKSSSQTRAM